jgi:hypothetical protein
MENNTNEEKIISAIDDDIKAQSQLVENQVEEEIKTLRADQIDFYREGLRKETDTYLEKELSDLRLYAATKASQDKLSTKRNLLALRTKMTNELFEEVRQDLVAFTKSAGYETYLSKCLDSIKVTSGGVFYVRQEDQQLFGGLLKKRGYANPMQDHYLPIGGFLYVDEASKIEISCSLDERRLEQLEWFRSNSGFTI